MLVSKKVFNLIDATNMSVEEVEEKHVEAFGSILKTALSWANKYSSFKDLSKQDRIKWLWDNISGSREISLNLDNIQYEVVVDLLPNGWGRTMMDDEYKPKNLAEKHLITVSKLSYEEDKNPFVQEIHDWMFSVADIIRDNNVEFKIRIFSIGNRLYSFFTLNEKVQKETMDITPQRNKFDVHLNTDNSVFHDYTISKKFSKKDISEQRKKIEQRSGLKSSF